MINVYQSKIHSKPVESHEIGDCKFIYEWLSKNVNCFLDSNYHPISIYIDDKIIYQSEWKEHRISEDSKIDIYPIPKSDDQIFVTNPVTVIGTRLAFGIVDLLDAAFNPVTPGSGAPAARGLSTGDIQANSIRIGSPIRETLGFRRIFPDFASQSITRFQDKRRLVNFSLLSVGAGNYQIDPNSVKIGETPISSFGADADVDIYEPNDDISQDSRSEIWYQASEVGSTSGGTAGLNLGSTAPSGDAVTADSLTLNLKTITIVGTGVSYPSSWNVGTTIRLLAPDDVTVSVAMGFDVFTGNFQDLVPFVGMKVTLSTTSTDYNIVVATYTDNSGVSDQLTFNDDLGNAFNVVPVGTSRISIGYRGNQYQIVSISGLESTINRLTDAGIVDAGWTGFQNRSVTDFSLTSNSADSTNWIGPFFGSPNGRLTNRFEYDVYFPSGLIIFNDDGDKRELTRSVELEWRDSAIAGTWTTITNAFTEITSDAIGFTFSITLPYSMRPEIRMRRVEPEGTNRASDTINWYRLRALMPERPTSYSETMMAITVRAGDRLSAQTDNQISVEGARIYSGALPSSRISDAFYRVTDSLNIPRSQIDNDQISSLEAEYWTPRGEQFNLSATSQLTAREVLVTILAAGMSQLRLSDGLISATREGIKEASGVVTPNEQVTPLTTAFTTPSEDDVNGIDVEYTSSLTWEVETVECRVDGVTATKIEKISVDGVTSREKAWRIGMRRLRKSLYQRLSYETTTELDARNYEFFDRVMFVDDLPGTTQTSLITDAIVSVSNTILTASEVIDLTDVDSPKILIRRHDGTVTSLITPININSMSVTVPTSVIDFDLITDYSIEPARLVVCDSTKVAYSGIVSSIGPSNDGQTTIRAAEYSEQYYADDDNSPE